jgi:hypothetical protein
MKKIGVAFGLFMAVVMVVFVAGSGNYSPSNFSVEQNLAGALLADGSPRPPIPPPPPVVDGSPRPPIPPAMFDGSPRPPFPPGLSA